MKPKVYLETSIISYLAARPSRDLVVEANRTFTHDWWNHKRQCYELFVSDFVYDKARKGDESAAKRRILIMDELKSMKFVDEAMQLSQFIMQMRIMPKRAAGDAIHTAIAIHHGREFLTWNCRHLSNVDFQKKTDLTIKRKGTRNAYYLYPKRINR